MRNSIGYYAGFLVLLAVIGGVWLAARHVIGVVRKVRTLISQATDESPFLPDEAVAESVARIMAEPEGLEYRESLDFDRWEAECACRPRIAKYVAKLEERAR